MGVSIDARPGETVLSEIRRRLDAGERVSVMYVNAHTLNVACREPALRRALHDSSFVLNDGVGVQMAGRLRGRRFPENLNGSDFTPRLLALAAATHRRVFLLGGAPGVAARAAMRLRAVLPELRIVGTRHGYHVDPRADAAAVRASRADVILVALGNPAQELWLDRWLAASGAQLGVAVGAFLDFQSGDLPRAPAWMNRVGLEWVYRLASEPRRLWRRYVIGNPLFIARALLDLAHIDR